MIARLSRVLTVFRLIPAPRGVRRRRIDRQGPHPRRIPRCPRTNTRVPTDEYGGPADQHRSPGRRRRAVPPTATARPRRPHRCRATATRPAATATATRPSATARLPASAATATRSPRPAAGTVMTDADKGCQVTLPHAPFQADAAGRRQRDLSIRWQAFLNLASFQTPSLSASKRRTELFIEGFTTAIESPCRRTSPDRRRSWPATSPWRHLPPESRWASHARAVLLRSGKGHDLLPRASSSADQIRDASQYPASCALVDSGPGGEAVKPVGSSGRR